MGNTWFDSGFFLKFSVVLFLFIFLLKLLYLFIFGCVGSSLLCTGFSLVVASGGFFVVMRGLLVAWASLVAEHGL